MRKKYVWKQGIRKFESKGGRKGRGGDNEESMVVLY
jgi:hypothetical protein